jgi:uncharacterized protein (TIGR03382 family)
MVRNLALVVVLAAGSLAHANGRAPNTSTINFRQGNEQDVAAGMTFGLVISHDGGTTWHWMCEKAVLYGGMYDPDYAYNTTGILFATTFDGSLVMKDGCTFEPTTFGKKFFSSITQGPDHALYMAAAEVPDTMGNPGDAKIYKSTTNGTSFNAGAAAGQINDWYNSIEVAPTDATRVYLSGYRLTSGVRSWQIYRSNNGGTSFTPVPSNTFTTSENSTIDIVGIKPGAPDTVFVRVSLQNSSIGDAIWRSDNGGTSWTKILEKSDEIAFLVRANGDLVAGTRNSGTFVARAPNNTTWETVTGAPHINCLVESAAGEVWACTQNFGSMQTPSDGAGIMKTTNLTSWTNVLKFQDILGPVTCAAGTRQHDQCVYDCPDMTYDANPATCPNAMPTAWCSLKNQLGITSTAIVCPAVFDEPPGQDLTTKPPKGCCQTGDSSGGPAALAISLAVGTVVVRRRRRRAS